MSMLSLEAIVDLERAGRRFADGRFRAARSSGSPVAETFPCTAGEIEQLVEVRLFAEMRDLPVTTAAQWIAAVAWARWAELTLARPCMGAAR